MLFRPAIITLLTLSACLVLPAVSWATATDRSEDLQRLLDRRGDIQLPEGIYVAGDLVIHGHTRLRGVAGKTIIKQSPGSRYILSVNPGEGGTADPASNENGIEIRDLIFEGRVVEDGFSEHSHTLNFNAVTDLLVENCVIKSFRGDGIYLGSSTKGGLERHNLRVTVRNCLIDGTNRNNRNGITVIDGTDIVITGNTFRNCTRADMPGAIDIEPNAQNFHEIRNIEISRNFFSQTGGNIGLISVVLPFKNFRNPPTKIRIIGNVAEARGNIGIHLGSGGNATERTSSMDVLVEDNVLYDAALGLRIFGMRGVTIRRNIIDGTELEPLLGYITEGYKNLDVTLKDNVFRQLSRRNGLGLSIFSGEGLSLEGNIFIDCGRRDGIANSAISLRRGQTNHLRIVNNRFFNPAGVMNFKSINIAPDHRLDLKTLTFENNRLEGRKLDPAEIWGVSLN